MLFKLPWDIIFECYMFYCKNGEFGPTKAIAFCPDTQSVCHAAAEWVLKHIEESQGVIAAVVGWADITSPKVTFHFLGQDLKLSVRFVLPKPVTIQRIAAAQERQKKGMLW